MRPPASSANPSSANSRMIAHVVETTGADPKSVALFAAMNGCGIIGAYPHPIYGRNSGVLAAWHAIESRIGDPSQPVMNALHRTFFQNQGVLRAVVVRDPLWQQGRLFDGNDPKIIEGMVMQVTAQLMFWSRPNAIVEATDALEKLLIASDLGDDLPADLFRPPVPATYVRFGKTFQGNVVADPSGPGPDITVTEGVYVFETVRETLRVLALVPIFSVREQRMFFSNSIEIIVEDENEPLTQIIQEAGEQFGTHQGSHFDSIVKMIVKVFLYMSLAQTAQIEERSYTTLRDRLSRIGPKKAAKLQRQLPDLYDRIILGPQEIHVHGHGELSPHLRRGHFRMQPHGPQNSLRKVMFIAPTWVRADRLAGHE